MEFLILVSVSFAIGAIFGISAYRYMLKRDPATLEKWLKEGKAVGDKIKDRF